MLNKTTRWMGTVAVLGAFLALPACDRDDHDDHDEMEILQVLNRGESGQPVIATWTRDGGWTSNSAIPDLPLGEDIRHSLGFVATAGDGDTFDLDEDGEYWIQFWLAPGAPTGIVDLDRDNIFHGDHVHIYGQGLGTTQIQFELWHVDHVENATTPISITVVEPQG
jgi:hypothetical protein